MLPLRAWGVRWPRDSGEVLAFLINNNGGHDPTKTPPFVFCQDVNLMSHLSDCLEIFVCIQVQGSTAP